MKLLHTIPMANLSDTYFLPRDSYGAFRIQFVGTNPAVAKTRADLGQFLLSWNGNQIINVDIELLSLLSDMKGGFATFTSVGAGALNASVYVPCGFYGDKNNSYLIGEEDRVYIKLDFPNLSDVVGGVIYIYGIPKAGVHNYFYAIQNRWVVAGGASTIADTHPVNNIAQVFLKSYASVSRVQLSKDNELLVDALIGAVQSDSDFNNQIESTGTLIEVDANLSKDVREVVSNQVSWQYTFTGASTLQQYFAYCIFSPSQAIKSTGYLRQKLSLKSQTGRIIPKIIQQKNVGVEPGGVVSTFDQNRKVPALLTD